MNRSRNAIPMTRDAMTGGEQSPPFLTDADREELIEAWRKVMVLEPNEALKRIAWGRMAALIGERSPQYVERMERERGLR